MSAKSGPQAWRIFVILLTFVDFVQLSPFDVFIISHLEEFVKSFFQLFESFFELSVGGLSLTDIDSIPHPHTNCNRQNAQIWENFCIEFCLNFLLTKAVGCGIMENSASHNCARAAEKSIGKLHKKASPLYSRDLLSATKYLPLYFSMNLRMAILSLLV